MENDDCCCLGCSSPCRKGECDEVETNSPQGEFNATDCSGAGRPSDLNEPGVQGPGEILAKLKTYIENECDAANKHRNESELYRGWRDACEDILQHLAELLGVEANEPPQDAE